MAPVNTVSEKKRPSKTAKKRTGARSTGKAGFLEKGMSVVNTKIAWKHPIHLVHAVTSRCNARCGFCAWMHHESATDELTTEEILSMYAAARKEGFHWLIVWGGEPLIHPDIGKILRGAHELGFSNSLVTNGFLLPRKLHEVLPYLARLNISLDYPNEKHDEIRGLPGLYEKIIDATKTIKKKYPKIPIIYTYTLHRDNCDQAGIKEMAALSHEIGAAVIFNPLRVEAASDSQDDLNLQAFNATQEQIAEAFSLVGRLKSSGHSIVNSFTYIDAVKKGPPVYRCHWPKINLPIEANGDVVDCMNWGIKPVANVRENEFSTILKNKRLLELGGSAGERCHKCISHHRMEMSEIYEGNFEPLRSWGKALSPQILRPTAKRHNFI